MRISTAGGPDQVMVQSLFDRIDGRLIINVGAGRTGTSDPAKWVLNVDHVAHTAHAAAFVAADVVALPIRDGAADGVLLKDVLEHVDDPIGCLTEARRACRHGGTAVVVVPRAVPRVVWNDPTHIRGFTARALDTALDMSGWTLREPLRRLGGFPGVGRVPALIPHLPTLLRVPGIGHRFGINWLAIARAT